MTTSTSELMRVKHEEEVIEGFSDGELAELKPLLLQMPIVKKLPDFARKSVESKPVRQSGILRSALILMLNEQAQARSL